MRISTRFAWIGALCALVAFAIAAAMIESSRRVAEQLSKNRIAADIVESVASLRYLTLEYARDPEERVEMQWASTHRSLERSLSHGSVFDSKNEQASFALMRGAFDDSADAFAELVRAQRARQAGEGDPDIMNELVRRLTASMVSRTLVLMTESFRLQDSSRERVAVAQRRVLATVGLLAAFLAATVGACMFFAFRGIARSLKQLSEGARRVGEGDLEHKIGLTGRDEVAEVAREFDAMSIRLRATTVSRDQLAESEERMRLVVETALDAVISMDSDGKITGWNPQAEAVFGWPRSEALGRDLSETIIPHRLREAHRNGLQRWLRTGEGAVLNRRVELSALRRDGSEFSLELTITPIRTGSATTFSAFLRDITERKHAEDRNHAQLARLDLLNQITRAISERQDLQSIYQVAVRTLEERMPVDFCCICRYEEAESALTVIHVGVGSHALAMELHLDEHAALPTDQNGLSRAVRGDVVYEEDIANVPSAFPQRLAQAGLRSMVIAPLQSESRVFGVLLVARRSANAFTSSDCEFLQQLGGNVALAAKQAELHDSLQQAYDELRQTQQAVLQQERLRALGQMASGIAHDINNAISPMMLTAESLLEHESGLSPKARKGLETIARAIDDVASTVARMREFYRQREAELKLVPVRLNELVQQVVELTRARWSDMPHQRGIVIDVHTELESESPVVMGVESEIREALTNLIFNAIDAMPEGGRLTMRTRDAERDHAASDAGGALIEVIDDGLGMTDETKRRCLEPFYTTKGERGTGLGLAMVYGVARRHGVQIGIASTLGKGTAIALRFPPMPSDLERSDGEASSVDARPPRMRILVVDDDPMLLKSLQTTLEEDGHIVVPATGGQAGIDTFRSTCANSEAFSVVITDLGMPYVDGRKVAIAIKEASAHTPVIMLTGWGQRLEEDGPLPKGVDMILSKPPKLRNLRQALLACSREMS